VNVYAVPFVRPRTVQEVALGITSQVAPPGEAVIAYELIAGPPEFDGGVRETVADPFPMVAVTPVGAPGFPAGLTDEEDGELELLPVALLATEENE
jgi:hypothetical protein